MTTASRLGDPAWLEVSIDGVLVPTSAVGPVTIRHGRSRVDEQPVAASLSTTLAVEGLPGLPSIGSAVRVELSEAAGDALGLSPAQLAAAGVRFVGDVTDLVDAPGAGDLTRGGRLALVATSRRARLGRLLVTAAGWPAELDGARAQRILDLVAADVDLTVADVDVGAFTVTARADGTADALSWLNTLAVDVDGLLVERRDGSLEWQDRGHRRSNLAAEVVLHAGDVLRSIAWQQNLAGVVNDLTIGYGTGSPQATVRETSPTSFAAFGPFAAAVSTQLELEADAATRAFDTVSRRALPAWRIEQLVVDLLRTVDPATARQLLALEVSDALGIAGFPASGPHATAHLYVEGWTEQATRDAWQLALAVSDYGLSAVPPRWIDVDPTVTWAGVEPPSLTWIGAASWPPQLVDDRWIDAPADQQWTDLDPAMSWTTYTNTAA